MMQMSPVTSPGKLSTDETMEENEEAQRKGELGSAPTVQHAKTLPKSNGRHNWRRNTGFKCPGDQRSSVMPLMNWNSGVKNPDSHISLESKKKHVLHLWAQEEYELVQVTRSKDHILLHVVFIVSED